MAELHNVYHICFNFQCCTHFLYAKRASQHLLVVTFGRTIGPSMVFGGNWDHGLTVHPPCPQQNINPSTPEFARSSRILPLPTVWVRSIVPRATSHRPKLRLLAEGICIYVYPVLLQMLGPPPCSVQTPTLNSDFPGRSTAARTSDGPSQHLLARSYPLVELIKWAFVVGP